MGEYMTATDWLDLLVAIPLTERVAKQLVSDRLARQQAKELIEMLSRDDLTSLAGLHPR